MTEIADIFGDIHENKLFLRYQEWSYLKIGWVNIKHTHNKIYILQHIHTPICILYNTGWRDILFITFSKTYLISPITNTVTKHYSRLNIYCGMTIQTSCMVLCINLRLPMCILQLNIPINFKVNYTWNCIYNIYATFYTFYHKYRAITNVYCSVAWQHAITAFQFFYWNT